MLIRFISFFLFEIAKLSHRLPSTFIGFLLLVFISCEGISDEHYLAEINDHRSKTEDYLKNSDSSPFVGQNFRGLQYYAIDRNYCVIADLEKLEKLSYLDIATSTGKMERYTKFGYASFKLQDQVHKLLLLKKSGALGRGNQLFLAFSDLTSGETTYGGGRYLDVEYSNGRSLTLDFNKAYNPYCEYNSSFNCPLPPPENKLRIHIKAGEKNYIPE